MSGTGRPTYRSKKGAADHAQSYFVSAHQMVRSLPGHQKLRLREKQDISKAEMLEKLKNIDAPSVSISGGLEYKDSDADSSSTYSNSDTESTSEDDENQQALLNELAAIRKERAEEEARRQQEEAKRQIAEMTTHTFTKSAFNTDLDWREETVFKHQTADMPEKNKQYINDPTRNQYHVNFLRKYLRT